MNSNVFVVYLGFFGHKYIFLLYVVAMDIWELELAMTWLYKWGLVCASFRQNALNDTAIACFNIFYINLSLVI